MKKNILISICAIGVLITGCAETKEQMATSVLDLAGNKAVIGWDNNVSSKNNNKEQKTKTKVKTKIIYKYISQKDSDGDLIPDNLDKCPNTPPGIQVDSVGCPHMSKRRLVSFSGRECPIKTNLPDEDRDGVEDSVDQCPGTPCDFSVDSKGCPIKAILRIHFATDSAEISDFSMKRVKKFAKFLLEHKGSLVHITGHTDNRASDAYNMVLSKKRADAVRKALIDFGVSSSRLSTEGRGERDPVASNATEQGMALNRRIEVTLTYPQYVEGR